MHKAIHILVLVSLVGLAGCAASQEFLKTDKDRFLGPDGAARISLDAVQRHQQATEDHAVALVLAGRYEEAMDLLEPMAGKINTETPRGRQLAAETYFWQAYCYQQRGELPRAHRVYEWLIAKWPETPAAENARLMLPPA